MVTGFIGSKWTSTRCASPLLAGRRRRRRSSRSRRLRMTLMSTDSPSPAFSISVRAPVDRLALGAVDMGAAVDHGLRRIDRRAAEGSCRIVLPRGVFRAWPACPSSRDSPSSRRDRRARRRRPASPSSASTASAGGQELQPWLVNSSTTPVGFFMSPAKDGTSRKHRRRRGQPQQNAFCSWAFQFLPVWPALSFVAGMLARAPAQQEVTLR